MKKKGVFGNLSGIANGQNSEASALQSRPQKKIENPGNGKPKENVFNTGTGKRLSSEVYLPVTQQYIQLTHKLVDPEEIYIGSYNRREQSLLSVDNPEIKKLMKSLASNKQRDPCLIRKVEGKDGFELVYGSRRLFAVQENNKLEIGRKQPLRCWIGIMSDADAESLSVAENEGRENISVYERGLYFKKQADKGYSNDVIAEKNNVSEATVRDGLMLATLDISIIQLLESPSAVTVTACRKLTKILKNLSTSELIAFIKTRDGIPKFNGMNSLYAELSEFSSDKKTVKVGRESIDICSKGKELKGKLTKHRKNEGQYKLDLFNMDDKQLKKITDAIKAL